MKILSYVLLSLLLILPSSANFSPGFLSGGTYCSGVVTITGGTLVATNGDYKTYRFDPADTSFTAAGCGTIDALLVGAGGGAGAQIGGGGGGGGVIKLLGITPVFGSNTISIGTGGAGGPNGSSPASNGGNTTAFGYTAFGGGAGGTGNVSNGSNGGSGGGCGIQSGPTPGVQCTKGLGTAGQGQDGGDNNGTGGINSGGGGGCGTAGGVPSGITSGYGGDGCADSITGSSVYYGPGGGGGGTSFFSRNPGTGGAGQGFGGGSGGYAGAGAQGLGPGAGGGGGGFNNATNPAGGAGDIGNLFVKAKFQ